MNKILYIKFFRVFLALTFVLLLLITFVFDNFYLSFFEKKDSLKKEITSQIQEKELSFYIKSYDDKIKFIESIISKQKNLDDITTFIKNSIFKDENILDFKIVGFDSKEILKLKNYSQNEDEKLRSLYFEEYFKYLQSLNEFEIYHFYDTKTQINFAIRGEINFYILKVDLTNILNNISNSSIKYTDKNDFFKEDYKYFIFAILYIFALILAFFFIKQSKKIELENQKLNFDINKTDTALNKNQKIMDKYIMYIQIDYKGAILEVSQAFCSFVGFSRSELIGNSYKLFFYKDIQKSFRKRAKDISNKDNFQLKNLKGRTKNGEFLWADILIEEQILDDETKVYNIICQDVTDKKRTYLLYKNLNMKIEEYDAIFENVHSGIALLTLDFRFVKLNNQMTNLLGFKEKELLNMTPLDIVNNSSKGMLTKILTDIHEFTNISKLEYVFTKKDGTPLHLELSLILMLRRQRIIFIINSIEDRIELKELNANLENTIKKEIERSKAKDKIHHQEQLKSAKLSYIGMLSAGITHEINTPLTYIKGNLELMQFDIEDLPNSNIKDRMLNDSKKIKDGINRIANIVESMREISHSNEEIKGSFNIYSTLLTALTMAHNRAKHISKIYINDDLFSIDNIKNDKFSFFSCIQKQRVEQIWIIIINNALDELVKIEDYEKRELRINIFEEDDFIVVKFKDNAKGLSKDILNKLFEPFTSSKESGGMGIGLSIAKKIVEEHKGDIRAYNENGAVFEVKLKKYKEEESI
ncbi:PAS domain-containing sensor histidine kinase [Aliarcobacter lanthieri]|uniref:PAS domain-containing sensor histidine kinase n=1 Tax=Aliarcobacter lanthieri TaxID=1355374 RepID=UPI003AFAFCA3